VIDLHVLLPQTATASTSASVLKTIHTQGHTLQDVFEVVEDPLDQLAKTHVESTRVAGVPKAAT
jgi:hypothetical protein